MRRTSQTRVCQIRIHLEIIDGDEILYDSLLTYIGHCLDSLAGSNLGWSIYRYYRVAMVYYGGGILIEGRVP